MFHVPAQPGKQAEPLCVFSVAQILGHVLQYSDACPFHRRRFGTTRDFAVALIGWILQFEHSLTLTMSTEKGLVSP